MFDAIIWFMTAHRPLVNADYRGAWPSSFVADHFPTRSVPKVKVVAAVRANSGSVYTAQNKLLTGINQNSTIILGSDGHTTPQSRWNAAWNAGFETYYEVRPLLANDQIQDTLNYLDTHPASGDAHAPLDIAYADCYLRLGKPREALNALSPWVAKFGRQAPTRLLVEASLAAALCNEAYRGQADFIREFIAQRGCGQDCGCPELMPKGDSYASLAAMSAIVLAAGMPGEPWDGFGTLYYSQIALECVPGNTIASAILIKLTADHGNWPLFYKTLDSVTDPEKTPEAANKEQRGYLAYNFYIWRSIEKGRKKVAPTPTDPHDLIFGNPALRKKIMAGPQGPTTPKP